MFRIRQSAPADVEQVLAVAAHLDTVNLPADRGHIESIVARSVASFAGAVPAREREFLFVLEDQTRQTIIGTSIIYAQHGTKRAPHVFFRVEPDERYSISLDKHFVHTTLRIGYNYDGPTEIGGLILLPEYRGNREGLGKALSFVRFLFMRMHRAVFRDQVLSELLPPLDANGTSLLWEHVGRHFTGLTYQEADLLSKDNKEFINALFPDDPIHTELLPPDVQALIGQVGPETKGVEKMLRRIGFAYANQIDPFDGGPHFVAKTDDISLVRNAREAKLRAFDAGDGTTWAMLAVEHADDAATPGFVAAPGRVTLLDDGTVVASPSTLARLGVSSGGRAWVTFE